MATTYTDISQVNGTTITPVMENVNGFTKAKMDMELVRKEVPQQKRLPDKYRHIAAVHSMPRTSCLSHDSEAAPSFLGFRNLMVIVLSGSIHFQFAFKRYAILVSSQRIS